MGVLALLGFGRVVVSNDGRSGLVLSGVSLGGFAGACFSADR